HAARVQHRTNRLRRSGVARQEDRIDLSINERLARGVPIEVEQLSRALRADAVAGEQSQRQESRAAALLAYRYALALQLQQAGDRPPCAIEDRERLIEH